MGYPVFLWLGLLYLSCTSTQKISSEFRGVWVASVVNIDWPKNGVDSVEKQKKDFQDLLDYYEKMNFNAAIVQIRTAGDAFYPTKYAPWSRYLSGKEGMPKSGFDDPLQWMITETHKRGMQFHAWFNPYRATFDLDTTKLAQNHDFFTHRDWMIQYGKKHYYNPGIPEVWQHLTQIVEEVVTQYPIDGVHFDDYFYPYKEAGAFFNDSLTFTNNALPHQSLEDWRRSNIDSLVKNVHLAVKKAKPYVQFGISPFGVWKNQSTDPLGSDTQAGQTTYEDLYADPLVWMNHHWIDYIVPQAYWSMDYPPASHRKISLWWTNNSPNTLLYMGNGPYKIRNNSDQEWHKKKELAHQLQLARSLPKIQGNVFFSAKSLPPHTDVTRLLQRKFYKQPIKTPNPTNGIKRNLPQPMVSVGSNASNKQIQLCVSHHDSIPRFLLVYKNSKLNQLEEKFYLPHTVSQHCFKLNKNVKRGLLVVQDAFGNESKPIAITY